MKINDSLMARIEEDARRMYPDGGECHYAVCELCGSFEWMSTSTKEPFGIMCHPMGMERNFSCGKCADAIGRAPELTQWVLDVIGMHIPKED